ncbi:MAG: helicase [Candidatus Lumbricidophila eiseniae]|uniref:Helicase n=1 Tax=Candidatus Lumbricidiphila eiseniae TaxID=1969409 RepID=A0A2A6FSF6_9MICO|nr:MAG: helicase [Candidatus Lumbricidophila eiseniae]
MATVDQQIYAAAESISANIEALSHDRGLLSQNVLNMLRDLVEAIAVRFHAGNGAAELKWGSQAAAINWIGSQNKQISFLQRFHKRLQESISHYTPPPDRAERLMLSYYEYLLRIRTLLRERCGIEVLENLEKFPIDREESLQEYHQKIAEQIDLAGLLSEEGKRERYYIHKVRPFFVGGRIYYEVTFSVVNDRLTKVDRIISFTDIDLTDKYAAQLTLVPSTISVLGQTMPITIIRAWDVAIRGCEFNNFARILGHSIMTNTGSPEYHSLMQFLTGTAASLLDLMDMSDAQYDRIRGIVLQRTQKPVIFPVLDDARQIMRTKKPGHNLLRYLMLRMNNRIIKLQYGREECDRLSKLHLSYGCKPFEEMPFCTSPLGHNARFGDLLESIDPTERTHEFLAHRVKANIEQRGMLYTPVADLEDFGDVDQLIAVYNNRVYYKHTGRQLIKDSGHVFIREYEEGTVKIIERLQEFTRAGVDGYEQAVERWLDETQLTVDDEDKKVDDEDKKKALRQLFAGSRVALIYGAAGTGKSMMVNYIANYFGDKQKLLLAHTHPAVDNLKRKVSAQHTDFRTITNQMRRTGAQPEYDVLIIDECSIVSNSDLLKVLSNTSFKLLVLVGDVYQIESIQFGNWFSIIRSFVPKESVSELTKPHRTDNAALLDFWSRVRKLEGIEESISQHGYSTVLDASLFTAQRDDEIILCLNYDGLYGINNVNRLLQSSNTGKAAIWGVTTYKVGDPIVFNDSDRFRPVIFNNLKGRIVDIVEHPGRIQFDVWLDHSVTEFDVDDLDLQYVGDSTVRFDVYQSGDSDEDDETLNTTVPFQVAYAVSIHRAQGLEYHSVKVVITEANEEDLSHNIFYTAITRAREHLKIFWTPATEHAVLSRLEHARNDKDVSILRTRRKIAPVR